MMWLRGLVACLAAVLTLSACAGDGSTQLTPLGSPLPMTDQPRAERTPLPRRPRPMQPRAGQTYWAVYLAVGHPDEAADQASLQEAVQLARSLGVATQPGDLGCDVGAHTALELPDWYEAVALYFDSEHDARTFVEMSDFQPFAVLQVSGHEECFT